MRQTGWLGRTALLGALLALATAGCSDDSGAAPTTVIAAEATSTAPGVTTEAVATTTPQPDPPVDGEPADPEPTDGFSWWRRDGDPATLPFGNVVAIPDGYAVAEAVIGGDEGVLWTSADGIAWSPGPLPVEAPRPLLVHNDAGYWLMSTTVPERVWLSTDFVEWSEIDTAAIRDAHPAVTPYLDGSTQPLNDLSPWNVGDAFVSNGWDTVSEWVTPEHPWSVLVASHVGFSFTVSDPPWGALHFPSMVEIVPDRHRVFPSLLAYVAGENLEPPGQLWRYDGVWSLIGEFPFVHDPAGILVHGYEVVERDGTYLALTGSFCAADDVWRSRDGLTWTHVGEVPEPMSCGGTLRAADSGWVLIDDGGVDPPSPGIWVSTDDGSSWVRVSTEGLDITGGDGSTPRSQLGVSVVDDTIFIQGLAAQSRTLWVGRWGASEGRVTIGDGSCDSTLADSVPSGSLTITLDNRRSNSVALVIGGYHEGFDRDDLVAYGRDISTRPPFVDAVVIADVAPSMTEELVFDAVPGRYFVMCLDTPNTGIVLPDLVVVGQS